MDESGQQSELLGVADADRLNGSKLRGYRGKSHVTVLRCGGSCVHAMRPWLKSGLVADYVGFGDALEVLGCGGSCVHAMRPWLKSGLVADYVGFGDAVEVLGSVQVGARRCGEPLP
ncbi:ABC transporter C family member 3 [Dorcoceras hygrometricum]|uniref:ABC transporter C family member 3 n=1 Tax=Dorcoceras hygrometricum TaxID=472368 RepID=A0A2Z7AY10_9LAMI|nr:ABC transporter C family member 3 [Dorcoceras hygrometricum]